ncbi:tRNA 2-thiouridine synthesizing protein A [Roseobacter denitrificans OCh 114]|nr:tRNA 2-thiouridine synthesizing protein A [Roseobacter denitrificans OCh 114]
MDRTKHRAYLNGMTKEIHLLDATGLLCPLPVLKARKRLQSLASGEVLTMHADDPAAIVDVPHFCSETGHHLVSSELDGPVQVYVIRKK